MPEQRLIQTSSNVKQNFRDNTRRYFRSELSSRIQYIRDIVLMLMNFKDINILEKELGEEEYKLTLESLQKFGKRYSNINIINDGIIKMQDKGDSDLFGRKIDKQNKKLEEIAKSLPAINYRIMRAFFILVNNCDLRNVSVPKEERWSKGSNIPSYLQDEKKSF